MNTDIAIIGGGPGGYVAAIYAAKQGKNVTLIEKATLGGTCLNRGCIPTKSLYKNAELLNSFKSIDKFGIKVDGLSFELSKAMERKEEVVERLVGGIQQLLKANGVSVIIGNASLKDSKTILIESNGSESISLHAEKIIIATGSSPIKLPIEGASLEGVFSSEEALTLTEIPKSIVIIGGGVIGIEFAGILNAFGASVTVLEYTDSIIPQYDKDVTKRLQLAFKKKGMSILTGVKVEGIEKAEDGLIVKAVSKNVETQYQCDSVLMSVGRKINIEGLNLDAIGLEYSPKGIKVNNEFMTNIDGIYAIGDVIGGKMLAHVASEQGKAAVDNILGKAAANSFEVVPSCVYTFPECAAVGLTEEEVKSSGKDYVVSKFMLGANGKALTMGEEDGFVKVIAEKHSKLILGVHIMGVHASDIIHEATLAMENGLTVEHIEKTIHAHPSLSEALWEAVAGVEGKAIHLAPVKGKV